MADKLLQALLEMSKHMATAKQAQAVSLNQVSEDKKTVFAEVVRSGAQILIPNDMTIAEARRILKAKEEEEEQPVRLQETFDCFIAEGLYAMAAALDKKYGWFQQITERAESFFDSDTPPSLVSVATGPNTTVQVPFGRFLVPNIPKGDGWFHTTHEAKPGSMIRFKLMAELKKKHSKQFHDLCAAIREELKTTSLYRGKAVSIRFRTSDGEPIKFPEPEFPAISDLSPGMIFSQGIEAALEANLFTPITQTEQLRKYGIPVKRGIALAGPYGCGKTLVATRTKQLAVANGWTFVMCTQAKDFADCVKFAHNYQPAIVFCEDIDRETDGDRDEELDAILNTIDGVDSKNTEIMLVLTTNEVQNIHPAMLRPGRLDALLTLDYPDSEAVGRLIRYYSGDLLPETEGLRLVGDMLQGSTPAVIREVVERAKLAAISLNQTNPLVLSEKALIVSADTMHMHRRLLEQKPKTNPTQIEAFGKVVGWYLAEGIKKAARTYGELGPDDYVLDSSVK
jgi:transitional endoplasmic reticulum ATPase